MLYCLYHTHNPTQSFLLKPIKTHPPTHCAPFKIHFPCRFVRIIPTVPFSASHWNDTHFLFPEGSYRKWPSCLSLPVFVLVSRKHATLTQPKQNILTNRVLWKPSGMLSTLYTTQGDVKNSILTSESQVNSLIAQEVEGLWYLKVIVVTVNTCLL